MESADDSDLKISTDKMEKKSRYIVFIGNLPFSATKEDVKEHFDKLGGVKDFRLMTKTSGESKGCGFLEFDDVKSQQMSLKYHHTQFLGRKINVEVTCGGGGNSKKRREKIMARNKKARRNQKQRSENLEFDEEYKATESNKRRAEELSQNTGRNNSTHEGEKSEIKNKKPKFDLKAEQDKTPKDNKRLVSEKIEEKNLEGKTKSTFNKKKFKDKTKNKSKQTSKKTKSHKQKHIEKIETRIFQKDCI